MLLHFVGFCLVLSVCLLHVKSQENATVAGNATVATVAGNETVEGNTTVAGNTTKLIMVRPLHKKVDEKKKDMMHIVIHKVLPGDPYYRVFDGDQAKARSFTNKIWQRLLDRYNTMLI